MENTPKNSVSLEIPNDILFSEVDAQLATGRHVMLNVRGCSMNPFIDGDRDSVELARQKQISVGDVALAKITTGQFVLHRIVAIDNESITLMGDGNLKGKEHCRASDVLAIALNVKRPSGRILNLRSNKSARRARLWQKLLPIRRYLLAFYRHFILPLK